MNVLNQNRDVIVVSAITVASLCVLYFGSRWFFSPKAKLKRTAKKDMNQWNGKVETDPAMSKVLQSYWAPTGINFTPEQMQSASVQDSYPWSSAYIGHLATKSGFKNFTPVKAHSYYTVQSITNRKNNLKKSFWGYKAAELKPVEIGDILVKNRSGNNYSMDTIFPGALTHGDMVVDIAKRNGAYVAILQGGNVSNTVKRTTIPLSNQRTLLNNEYFGHLKYKS